MLDAELYSAVWLMLLAMGTAPGAADRISSHAGVEGTWDCAQRELQFMVVREAYVRAGEEWYV